ncbi:hypothetical protein ABT264_23870 [Streptomyces virginiae]|nr:hypothetical protein OG293_11790 [Streptomyces sp. NBC_00829]
MTSTISTFWDAKAACEDKLTNSLYDDKSAPTKRSATGLAARIA